MASVYIVLYPPEAGIGGAEKRIVGLWLHLQRHGGADAKIVVDDRFYATLRSIDELADAARFERAMVRYPTGATHAATRANLARALRRLHREDARAVFHYVNVAPNWITARRSRHIVYTYAGTHLGAFNRVGRAYIHLACLRSSRIDLLDQDVCSQLAGRMPWKRGAFSTTPNSFVDLDYYAPLPFEDRRDVAVYLGTFSEGKQAFRLLRALPRLDELLARDGSPRPEYLFLGKDHKKPGLVEEARDLGGTLKVDAYFSNNPREELRRSKIFFSVQATENYPSKSLLEAIACGCIPIVTDVGKSRRIATDASAYFVPGDFSPEDLARCVKAILSLGAAEYGARVAAGREFLRQHFSIDTMVRYYVDLYERA